MVKPLPRSMLSGDAPPQADSERSEPPLGGADPGYNGGESTPQPDDPKQVDQSVTLESDAAMQDDLQLRLFDSHEREVAARSALQKAVRELALMRRLARFARLGAPPAVVKVGEIPRCSASVVLDQPIYSLDFCENRGAFTFIAGWAFHPNPAWNGRDTTVKILFQDGEATYQAPTGKLQRLDVAAHYASLPPQASGGARGLDGVGFASEILHESLPADREWQVTLRLECGTMVCEVPTGQRLRC